MQTYRKYSLPLLLICLFTFSLSAKEIPPRSNKIVTDYIGLLSNAEQQRLEQKLVAYDDSTSTQIAIVIESSLEGEEIFDYSYRLAESWGIGREGKNNGILIYIAFQDRQLYIQTGYGTEGFLTDAMAKRIIDRVITPAFRSEAYYEGLNEATDIIMKLGSGEYDNTDLENNSKGTGREALFILFGIILVIVILSNIFGGGDDWDDGGYNGRGKYDDYDRPNRRRSRNGGWIYIPGGGGWNGGGGGGGFGGGGFGGFGGGGFGGGGFSGGGGGFGGGGAGGSW